MLTDRFSGDGLREAGELLHALRELRDCVTRYPDAADAQQLRGEIRDLEVRWVPLEMRGNVVLRAGEARLLSGDEGIPADLHHARPVAGLLENHGSALGECFTWNPVQITGVPFDVGTGFANLVPSELGQRGMMASFQCFDAV